MYLHPGKSINADYSVVAGDVLLLVDAGALGVTITLLPAAQWAGQTLLVKKIAGAGVVTIDGNGAETIDGVATAVLNALWASYTIVSTGSACLIL